MRTRHSLLMGAACTLLALSACSSDSGDGASSESTTAPSAAATVASGNTPSTSPATTATPATEVDTTESSAATTDSVESVATTDVETTDSPATTVPREPVGQATSAGRAPDSPFCQTLSQINAGTAGPGDVPPYQFLAGVASALVAAGPPDALRADLTQFATTLGGIKTAVDTGQPVLIAFAGLINPDLVELEHRLAHGIGDECGVLLSDPATWPHPPSTAAGVTGDVAKSICPGWPSQTNAVVNNRFPYTIDTSGANYWGLDYTVQPGGWIEMHGEYPHARYFSILPNDQDTNNLAPLTDVHIDPDPGSVNPWRTVADPATHNFFTIRLRFDPPPADPEPNTSYVAMKKDGVTPNASGKVVLRIYGSDEGDQPNSAGVALPSVTVYAPDGSVVSHQDECVPYPDGAPTAATADVPSMPPLPFLAQYTPAQPKISLSSNYSLPVDLLANPDVQYATIFMSHQYGDLLVIRAKAFTSPDTRAGESPSTQSEVEGWTVCNYNLAAGIANTCKLDHDIAIDDDGYYTLVVSTVDDRPTNATAEQGATWFDWGPYLDNQITWRLFPRDNALIQALAADVESGTTTLDQTPQAVYCDKETYESGGWTACAAKA